MMYAIGHILYVVLSKKNQVYPMQVVEIITKKTLKGEEVSYILQAGSEKTSRVSLDQVDGELFDTPEKARRILTQRATTQVNKLVDFAMSKSVEWYGEPKESSQVALPQMISNLPDLAQDSVEDPEVHAGSQDDTTSVVMPDGSIVKVKMPKFG